MSLKLPISPPVEEMAGKPEGALPRQRHHNDSAISVVA